MKPFLVTLHNGSPQFHDVTDAAVLSGFIRADRITIHTTPEGTHVSATWCDPTDPEESRARASLEPGIPQPPVLPDGVPDFPSWGGIIYLGKGSSKTSHLKPRYVYDPTDIGEGLCWDDRKSDRWSMDSDAVHYADDIGGPAHRAMAWFHESQLLPAAVEGEEERSKAAQSPSRNLLVVLNQILEIIPLDEMEIRRSLDLHHSANRYRAPEVQDWHGVAETLQLHLEGRNDPWVESSLAIWRNDPVPATYPPPESAWPEKPDAGEGMVWERMPYSSNDRNPASDGNGKHIMLTANNTWEEIPPAWESCIVFRAVPTPVTDPEWRELGEGEVIQEGDEWWNCARWVECYKAVGHRCGELRKVRRRVTPSQAKETTVGFPAVGTRLRVIVAGFYATDWKVNDEVEVRRSFKNDIHCRKFGDTKTFGVGDDWKVGLEIVEPAPLKLEVGKKYVNRKGEVVGPVELNARGNKDRYPFCVGRMTFDEYGAWCIGVDDEDDLIREHTEPELTPSDKEQAAFEKWLSSTSPSGDADSVKRQWEASSDYEDLLRQSSPKFVETFCSQCGRSFGPGDHGFSSCQSHKAVEAKTEPEHYESPGIVTNEEIAPETVTEQGVGSMTYPGGEMIMLGDWVTLRDEFSFDANVIERDAESNNVTLDREINGRRVWGAGKLKLLHRQKPQPTEEDQAKTSDDQIPIPSGFPAPVIPEGKRGVNRGFGWKSDCTDYLYCHPGVPIWERQTGGFTPSCDLCFFIELIDLTESPAKARRWKGVTYANGIVQLTGSDFPASNVKVIVTEVLP